MNKKQCPNDFIETFRSIDDPSVNQLSKHYNVSAPVITRWLNQHNIVIKKSNERVESSINWAQFKLDAASGNFTSTEIKTKYGLSNHNIHNICRRNNIKLKLNNKCFVPENSEEFIQHVTTYGKQSAAKKYNTTLASITGVCKRNNIDVPKYHGRVNNTVDVNCAIDLYNSGWSINQVAKMLNTNPTLIVNKLKKAEVKVETAFDKWRQQRVAVSANIQQYIEENRTSDLKQIALNHQISYEVLKTEFNRRNIDVILHTQNKSKGELEVKQYLQQLAPDTQSVKYKFDDKIFEIDCISPNNKFAIEYCGEYWHSDQHKPPIYHQHKYQWCKKQNINLMTIFEHEWLLKNTLLKSMIRNRLQLSATKIHGRSCSIMYIPKITAKIFHDTNHINGGLNTSMVDIGLFDKHNQLVSCASFSKSRFNKKYQYELLRFSTKQDTVVVGGFSKILSDFVATVNPTNIVSYCDLRFGSGDVYRRSGFDYVGTTRPNYWYYYKNSGPTGKFESRLKYQKHKLKQFSNYDISKTEYDIMKENGYYRIFDCGNHVFEYKNRVG